MFPTTCVKTAPLSGPARAGDRHRCLLEVHLLVASLQGQMVFPLWELASAGHLGPKPIYNRLGGMMLPTEGVGSWL